MKGGKWCADVPEQVRDRVGTLLTILGSRGDHPEERYELWEVIVPAFYEMDDELCYSIDVDDWTLRAWAPNFRSLG